MIEFVASPNNQQALTGLQRIVDSLLRPSPSSLSPIQTAIRQGFDENFATESAGGAPWAQLAPATVRQRILLGFGGEHPILQRSGEYRSTFTKAGNADHVSTINYDGGVIHIAEGSGSLLAQFLERGTSKMPARPVLELSQSAIDNVADAMTEMIDKILRP